MDQSPFKKYLSVTSSDINKQIEKLEKETQAELGLLSKKYIPLINTFFTSCAGGKRFRGAMVKLGYSMTRANIDHFDLNTSVAYEIFQTAILAHDDVIDRSPIRRGKSSMHIALGDGHYGVSQSISLGDLGILLSDKLILGTPYAAARKHRALELFIDTKYRTVLGQILDIELPQQDLNSIDSEDILTVYEYKTAYYTMIGPLSLGAILGGTNNKTLSLLENIGKEMGIAFQMRDDVLSIFGSESETGKSSTSDIAEGKITMLWYHAYANINSSEKKMLNRIYGNSDLAVSHQNDIRDLFIKSHALKKVEESIDKHIEHALNNIDLLDCDKIYKTILRDLCNYMIQKQ